MAKNKKNIVIANFPRLSREIWLPFLWTQAKTYYELYGERVDEWNWVPCFHDVFSEYLLQGCLFKDIYSRMICSRIFVQ